MDIKDIHDTFLQCDSVSIDTRKIASNSLFVAIKGERFDANTFASDALARGARAVVIDNKDYFIDTRTILVNNSLETLQALAKYHRQYLKLRIIALTGSNGKTTTKELIQVVLQKKFHAQATVGNLNNHIGVPLTLLSFNEKTEIGIVEMGANHQTEIEFLCSLAEPNYGYITNFGKAHLEGFGGVAGVIKGKSEMYQYLLANQQSVFINLDDPVQVEKSAGIKSFAFGINNTTANVNFNSVSANPFVTVAYSGHLVHSKLIGLYNANNINAAIAIGKYFKIDDHDIKAAIESYIPENNRSQLLHKGTNEIILDAYNANPSSMAVAIENFLQLHKSNKVAILGDMFELGAESLAEHRNIVSLLEKEDNTKIFFIGEDFFANKVQKSNISFYENFEQLLTELKSHPVTDSMMLIKGSRGMALERILAFL